MNNATLFQVLATALLIVGSAARADKHPVLPRVESALCQECHVRLVLGPRVVHPPVADDCLTCHDVSLAPDATTITLIDTAPDLCLLCHEDIQEQAQAAEVPHGALELATCTDCHNPHASDQDSLIALPGAGVCIECHEDQVPVAGEQGHGVVDLVGCNACHEPHGGSETVLLRRTGNELCLSCHDAAIAAIPDAADGADGADEVETVEVLDRFELAPDQVRSVATLRLSADGRGHPVVNHPVSGTPGAGETSFAGELGCLSCHDPHKGGSTLLLVAGAVTASESCRQCHPE